MKSATGEEILALRTFYFDKFFDFMNGLKEKREDTLEFRALWNNINSEAATAAAGGVGELQWRLVQVMFVRGLLLASGGGSVQAQDLLSKEVYLPMVDAGKIGITTLVKMWLHQIFSVPLTYGEYTAHGINLGSAVGAMHDEAHGIVDNRRREVKQAIINLLNAANTAGKNPRGEALPLATRHMVERFNALNQTLLAYVEAKERRAIGSLLDARDLAPEDANNAQRKEAEKIARREYNTGIAALFQALHEEYAMKANVLEAPTLEDAIARLCANATSGKTSDKFDELETFFNSHSDLSDPQIFEKIGTHSLESVGVHVYGNNGAIVPTTIAEYAAQGKVFMDTLQVNRGAVYTEILFDVFGGKRVKIQVPTTHYLVNTAKDENAVLGLVGQKVSESALPTDLEKQVLPALPEEYRRASLRNAREWLTEVETSTDALISGLTADLLTHIPAEARTAYNQLVADQNAEWTAFMPPVVAPAPAVTETALVLWRAPSQL